MRPASFSAGYRNICVENRCRSVALPQENAKNRNGFVQGALAAARWMKARHGFYDFSQVFTDILQGDRA